MAENSKIEWCDHTFNPWVGCTKLSLACDNCYAETWAKRAGSPELWHCLPYCQTTATRTAKGRGFGRGKGRTRPPPS